MLPADSLPLSSYRIDLSWWKLMGSSSDPVPGGSQDPVTGPCRDTKFWHPWFIWEHSWSPISDSELPVRWAEVLVAAASQLSFSLCPSTSLPPPSVALAHVFTNLSLTVGFPSNTTYGAQTVFPKFSDCQCQATLQRPHEKHVILARQIWTVNIYVASSPTEKEWVRSSKERKQKTKLR